jgi:hypothetical protein
MAMLNNQMVYYDIPPLQTHQPGQLELRPGPTAVSELFTPNLGRGPSLPRK